MDKSSTDHEFAQPLEVVSPAKAACSQVTYQPIPPAKLNSSVKSTRSISSGVAMSLPADLAAEQSSSIIINDNTPAHNPMALPSTATTQAQKPVHGF